MFVIILAVLFAVLLLVYHITTNGPTLSGTAQVLSRRVEPAKVSGGRYTGGQWNYMVTFALADGEELELYVTQDDFRELKEGLRGFLCWQKENLLSFEPEQQS